MTKSKVRVDGAIFMPTRQASFEADVELSDFDRSFVGRSRSMAPDGGVRHAGDRSQGGDDPEDQDMTDDDDDAPDASLLQRDDAQKFLAEQAEQDQNFSIRGVVVGLAIGVLIAFSNTYFGLQSGWVSGMAMPAALIGFSFFKTVARCIDYPFTPVENVLVQTVAGAVGTMPLGCGFVGVLPALNYLLAPEENGPLVLSTGKLIIWSLGIAFFGVVFAVPLRKEVIIREKLKFPSGTATALIIGILHGNTDEHGNKKPDSGLEIFRQRSQDIRRSSSRDGRPAGSGDEHIQVASRDYSDIQSSGEEDHRGDWKAKIRLLIYAFMASASYTLASYFIPRLRSLPIFGLPLANKWLWTLNPSPAYVGQGIIMGPATTLHMLLGAIVGWGILSPLAKSKEWAPGPVEDWNTGSKGWIVWVSLAIMLSDSIVSLGWLILRPLILYAPPYLETLRERYRRGCLSALARGDYTALAPRSTSDAKALHVKEAIEPDAPAHHLVSNRTVLVLLFLSILLCIFAVHHVFPPIPFSAIILSILLALILSIIGVRALGETDLNPVSGISKITQLLFALVIPASNPNAITINLVAGAISESGALQSADLLQDLKCGHLLGAAPRAQFWGQMIGSFAGAIVSAGVYKLYTSVYEVGSGLFQVPTAYVWIFTARLVTGKGLPDMAWQWALGAGLLFVALTAARVRGQGLWWQAWVPGGIAVAVGMYNTPSFTLARTIGGLVNWYWRIYRGREDTPVIVLASGLILGEGVYLLGGKEADLIAELPSGSKVISVVPSGTSEWVDTVRIEVRNSDGSTRSYFMKSQSGEVGRKMMEAAFHSESLFYKYIPNHVPKPYAWGIKKNDPSTSFYLCDFHDLTDDVPVCQYFVPIIVKIHKDTMGKQERYGFDIPTYLANIPNDNTWQTSWEVWFAQAMRQMFQIEESAHGKDEELTVLKKEIFEKVIPRLLRPLETGGRSIKPCLIHSDLWPGNAKPDAQTKEIYIFDSCAFWGHNEADLGSWRAPRYRMGSPFIEEYQRLMGISEPKGDWDDRNALYALRYDLLWSALFPRTEKGYHLRSMAKNEMARLVLKYPRGFEGFDEH